jgi:hypothetical protein
MSGERDFLNLRRVLIAPAQEDAEVRVLALVEFPRFRGHLSAWSALSGWAGRMRRYAEGIEFSEAVLAGVPA